MVNPIRLVLSNIPVVVVALSIIFILANLYKNGFRSGWKKMMRDYVLFFWVGIMYTWASIFHIVFPEMGAKAIGWKVSPFQKEVGFYDLVVGLGSLLVFVPYFAHIKEGVAFVVSGFSLLAGLNHVYEALVLKNKSKNNSGLILYMDILLPILMLFSYF